MEINIFGMIRDWGREKGLHKASPDAQLRKLAEELGEVAAEVTKGRANELAMEIGDMVVVLTNLAMIYGMDIEDCITKAYTKIEKRKGKTVGGVFVKDAEISEHLDDETDEYIPERI